MTPPRGIPLAGAVVLVTGASRGIGRATCLLLARHGATVVAVARSERELAEVAAATGGSALALDVTTPGAAPTAVAHALTTHGRLDAVVAAAGAGHVGALEAMAPERIAALVDLNLRAPMQLAAAAVPTLRARAAASAVPGGALVFVTSIAGLVGVAGESVYSATKAGLETFATVLRDELAGQVQVSTVAPGAIDTDLLRGRAVPYTRRVPRPLPPAAAAEAIVRALRTGAPRVVVPRWLGLPATLARVTPSLYRRGARRFG